MTSLKRLLRVKAFLLLILCLSTARTVNSAESNTTPQTSLITRKELIILGQWLAQCSDDGKPCSNKFGADRIALWLKTSRWRNPDRDGYDTLNYSDFEALHKKYGNALAERHSITMPTFSGKETFKLWVWDIPFPRQGEMDIGGVVDHLPPGSDNPYVTPLPVGLDIPIATYAKIIAQLMANDEKGQVTVDQFVNFMINKQ